MRFSSQLLLLFCSCLLGVSCSHKEKAPASSPQQVANQIPAHLSKWGASADKGKLEQQGDFYIDSRVKGEFSQSVSATRPQDIVFTKPGDTEFAASAELKEIWKKEYEGPWMKSFNNALRKAQVEGKPIFILFSSETNPLVKALDEEVLGKKEFASWAAENVIRLRFEDYRSKSRSKYGAKIDYIENLKKRFQVRAVPSGVLVLPNGTVTARYRGYRKGEFAFYEGRLRDNVEAAQKKIALWEADLEKKGYRIWTDIKKRTVMAKLTRYDDERLYLVQPDGKRSSVHESKLGPADRKWLREEKQKRGLL